MTPQTAKPANEENTLWNLKVKLGPVPIKLSYVIIACDTEDYSTCVVGDPGRNLLYLMARTPQVESAIYESMTLQAEAAGYDRSKIETHPQTWPSQGGKVADSVATAGPSILSTAGGC